MVRALEKRFVCGAVAIACVAACARTPPAPRSPNILLVSVDALRADHLSCYGYDRHTTPVLDALAARGTRFSRAFANTHGTPPSHATLLSSMYQESHRVDIGGGSGAAHQVPRELTLVQEIFSAEGWDTFAVTGGGYLSENFGFSRGFATYVDRARRVDKSAKILVDRLASRVGGDRPFFAFFHTYQVHSPYAPPAGFDRLFGEYQGSIEATSEALLEIQTTASKVLAREDFEYLEALYDGEIRYTDEILGELFASLDALGLLDTTVIIVTADHGEEFGEHGGVLHGGKLFEELLHVPLIISGGGVDRGVVEPALVSLIDVAPTVLALAGLEVPATMEGRNILDRPETGSWGDQRVYAQYGDRQYCVRTPRWKLIWWPADERVRLFDLHRDPGERRDLSRRFPEVTDVLVSELERWRAERPVIDVGAAEGAELPAEKIEELRALGYVE